MNGIKASHRRTGTRSSRGSSGGLYDPRYNKSIGSGGRVASWLMWSTKRTSQIMGGPDGRIWHEMEMIKQW